MSWGLLVFLAGCGQHGAEGAGRDASRTEALALNGALVVHLAEEPDPLSVTTASVRVSDGSGRVLRALIGIEGHELVTHLVIDASLLRDPPDQVLVSVVGGVSLVGVCARDGSALPSVSTRFVMRAELEDAPGGALELRALARIGADERAAREIPLPTSGIGSAADGPPDDVVLAGDERLALRFAGVLDPSLLEAQSVPLFPVGATGELPPVYPDSRWTVVGTASELVLDLTGLGGSLRFKSRRMTLRSLSGREVEPRVEFLVRRVPVR